MNDKVVKLLIADDHLIVREGLRLIIETVKDIEIIGEASTGREAVELAEKLMPDVILMDLRMPEMDGLEAIEVLSQNQPETAVIILTTFNEDELMRRGLALGARGFLLKDTDRKTLFENIRAAAAGNTLINPELMKRLLSGGSGADSKIGSGTPELTNREMEILKAASEGCRSKEIAWKYGITERTVKAHLASIYNKLGVDSRAAAAVEAVRRGWI